MFLFSNLPKKGFIKKLGSKYKPSNPNPPKKIYVKKLFLVLFDFFFVNVKKGVVRAKISNFKNVFLFFLNCMYNYTMYKVHLTSHSKIFCGLQKTPEGCKNNAVHYQLYFYDC